MASVYSSSNIIMPSYNRACRCDCSVTPISVQIMPSVQYNKDEYTIKKVDSSLNIVTISAYSGEKIDDTATYTLTSIGDYVTISPNGTGWTIVDESVTVNEDISLINAQLFF